MERALVKLLDAARKAADLAAAASDAVSSKGPEVSRCVDALNQLKTFPVTYDILVSTQNGFRFAGVMEKNVIKEASKGKKNGTASAVRVEKKEADGNTAMAEKINPGETGKIKKIYIDGKTKAKSAPKLLTLVKCNDPLRDKFREILVEALSKVPSETDEDMLDQVNACDPIWVAVTEESVMFRKMGKSNGTNKIKYRSIMCNMKDPKNSDLRRKVLLGEVNPERLITMTPEEMASEQRQRENKEIKEKALSYCERDAAPKDTTDQFKCRRCGKRETSFYELQTRSADEPRTTYVTCVNCNNHWEFISAVKM
ncbi:hypothetical protein Gogos_022372 [Gossypium gossypioides]|uniref:Transcription elongation factor n=1 Tax=Gossypium gossypioides TaxID=34282 RepID=A0A7J9D613_GOSGO|nr:hypothetical protein [Gossypium gossypioides]